MYRNLHGLRVLSAIILIGYESSKKMLKDVKLSLRSVAAVKSGQVVSYLCYAMAPDVKDYQDSQLVDLLRSGDVSAFTEIYRRYATDLYVVARNATGDSARAEDIVQEVFVSLWQKRLRPEDIALKGWLLLATRFQVLKAFRQNKSTRVFQNRLALLSRDWEQGDPLLHRELQRRIPVALQSLPQDQQTIFRLHRDEELTYREIAEQLGVSIKTVEKKMSLILRHLRLEIGELIVILTIIGSQV